MELGTAIKLIEKGINKTAAAQVWADLGAGNGLFTKALASLLSNDSIIYAIDKDLKALRTIHWPRAKAKLEIWQKDFLKENILLEMLDGIVMANALHYVSDPLYFLKQVKTNLKPKGNFILVEYDLPTSNQWIPYPVSYKSILKIASEVGFDSVTKLGETPSVYNRANMYSVLLQ